MMRVISWSVALLFAAAPLTVAHDPIEDVEREAHAVAHLLENIVLYAQTHADCDAEDLGHLQTDGVDANGAAKPCDAPDSLDALDEDRLVNVDGSTRGFLFFPYPGVDDVDVFRLPTQVDDREFRYKLSFDLGLSTVEADFGSVDFDVVTLGGDSLLTMSPAYDPPEGWTDPVEPPAPEFPAARPGHAYQETSVGAGYTSNLEQFKIVVTPAAGEAAPSAWVQLEDHTWVELALQSNGSTAKKYTAPVGDSLCGVIKIVVELPDAGVKKAPHVAHAPPQGLCEAPEGRDPYTPPPAKEPTAGEFTVPEWLAGQDLAVIVWVTEYTPEALQRQADEQAANAQGEVEGLLGPRTMSCDDQGLCASIFGEDGRANWPSEFDLDLQRLLNDAF